MNKAKQLLSKIKEDHPPTAEDIKQASSTLSKMLSGNMFDHSDFNSVEKVVKLLKFALNDLEQL
jgi:hypothetical protein